MADANVEDYKKRVAIHIDRWSKKLADINKLLAPIQGQIDKLEANKNPSDADKTKLKDLYKQRNDLRQKVADANTSLKVELSMVQLDPNADKKEAAKLPDWLEKLIKDKGVAISKYIVISADVDFDFKTGKLQKFVQILTVQW
jgi:hypothetical protein